MQKGWKSTPGHASSPATKFPLMSVNIEMPKLSDTMTEGTLIKWHKKVGDAVEIGDLIAEVETDKATMEMEAFDEGTITEILIPEGGKAVIGAVLAVLDGESAAPTTPSPSVAPAAATTPVALPPPATSAAPASAAPASTASGERVKASPLARKIAAATGVELSGIQGSGPGGRIVRKDVEAASPSGGRTTGTPAPASPAAAAATPAPPAPTSVQAILPVRKEGDQIIELSSVRRVIASRLHTSKVTIPHFYLHLEADVGPLMSLRKQINDQVVHTHGNKYSLNDFVLKAVINAAQAVPEINSSFAGDHIVRFAHVGLSVAIAVDDGLLTPVIKAAETQSLMAISRTVKDFAARAKDKKLRPDEFDGGTITVSNLGAWGIEAFDAIINPPQAAIVSVGAAIEKPVVKDGQVVPGLRMDIGLSCDHRVVDGAIAARFLAEVKKLIEQPALMLA